MKQPLKLAYIPAILFLFFAGCQKQNAPTPQVLQLPAVLSEAQLANLRAYKNSDHQLAFGWFGGSGGGSLGPSFANRFLGLPDSMDIISLWGGIPDSGSAKMAEMKYVQKQKGTKFVWVRGSNTFLGNFPQTPDGIRQAAKAASDTIFKYELDGLDVDYEPNVCGCTDFFKDRTKMTILVTALSQFLGPKSGTGKLLMIDGEVNFLEPVVGPYINYGIGQAYASSGAANLQSRYNAVSAIIPPEKFLVTENFESYWSTGGVSFKDISGATVPSMLGMAAWQPTQGKKAGAGSFHMEYEFPNTPDYKYMRQAIQIMNPSKQ